MALMLVPSSATKLWQALSGGNIGMLLRRLWPFLLPATVAVWLGAGAITLHWLEAMLLLLLLYAIVGLTGFRPPLQNAYERPVGVLCGMVNGALTGLTGSFVFPGVMFLHALRLERHQFVQAMGILFTLSTLALALALQGHGRLTSSLGLSSAFGLLPALIGMLIGSHIRHLLTEAQFRRVFFACVLCLGLAIVNSTVW